MSLFYIHYKETTVSGLFFRLGIISVNQICKITPQGELTLYGSCPDTGIIVIFFTVISQVFVRVLRHRLGVHKYLLEERKRMTQT